MKTVDDTPDVSGKPVAHVAPMGSPKTVSSDDSVICDTPPLPPRTRLRSSSQSSQAAEAFPTPAEAKEAMNKAKIAAFYKRSQASTSPAVTRLSSKLKSQSKRKASRQTPSPIKVASRVEAIEKALKKKPRKEPVLQSVPEESVSQGPSKDAKALLEFKFLEMDDKKDSDSDDDFKKDSPNMLVELARFKRLHAKAQEPKKKSSKSANK